MSVTLYTGKNKPSTVASHEPGVRVELHRAALQIGLVASGLLAAHHGNTPGRNHDLPPPTVEIVEGNLDVYVVLEATGEDGEPDQLRAIGIELGHLYQSRMRNRSGPWGQSGGIHIFDRAIDMVG